MGEKKLFYRDRSGKIKELFLTCVLDFFVCEEVRRQGHGKALYDFMLVSERQQPENLGIDSPSTKFLSFMDKHFGLKRFVFQTNSFVVFDRFFERNLPGRERIIDATNGKRKSYGELNIGKSNHKGFGNVARNILGTRENLVVNGGTDRSHSYNVSIRSRKGEQEREQRVFKENCLKLSRAKKEDDLFGYSVFGFKKKEEAKGINKFTSNRIYGCFYK